MTGRGTAILYGVGLGAMGLGARGVGPEVARHASLLVAVIAAGVVAGVLYTVAALALKAPNAWMRGALMTGATAALFFALHQIG